MNDDLLSWEAADKERENRAILQCARSLDRLNTTLTQRAWDWGFVPDNLRLFPTVPGRVTCGPAEMIMLRHLGLIGDDPPEILPFTPFKATD
ncbi:MAG: hypothetical protein H0X24_14575 [Ktedonobacterales bacterium]|nr:hypothetical protein [Ktedonobacterales bacterium]